MNWHEMGAIPDEPKWKTHMRQAHDKEPKWKVRLRDARPQTSVKNRFCVPIGNMEDNPTRN